MQKNDFLNFWFFLDFLVFAFFGFSLDLVWALFVFFFDYLIFCQPFSDLKLVDIFWSLFGLFFICFGFFLFVLYL